jgi:hypothetical protein
VALLQLRRGSRGAAAAEAVWASSPVEHSPLVLLLQAARCTGHRWPGYNLEYRRAVERACGGPSQVVPDVQQCGGGRVTATPLSTVPAGVQAAMQALEADAEERSSL